MCVGDVHLADRPPSSCTDSYLQDLWDLLAQAAELAERLECSAVVQAGDMFHLKTPGRTSHRLMQRAIYAFEQFPCPVFVVPGNHDMSHDRFDSVFDQQPLGVLLKSGACHLLSGWSDAPAWAGKALSGWEFQEEFSGLPLYGIPWLQHWASSRDVADEMVREATEDLRSRTDGSTPTLVVTHAPFYPPGLELTYEFFPTAEFAELLPDRASVYYGHVHEAHGVYRSGDRTFCNVGALSRGSLAEHNLTRAVSVAVWDSLTGAFEVHELPHRPASEVFRLVEKAAEKSRQADLDSFLSSVGAATIEITSIEAVLQHVKGLGLDPAVVSLVEELLTEAQG
jgi:DNA repair exonuclease SbcCD nuclease subunit